MSGNKLWSIMSEEEWQEERERVRKIQESHTKSVKREEVE